MRNLIAALVAVCAATIGTGQMVVGQEYPSRDITMIIPYSAGGGTDLIGRVVAENLSRKLGVSVLVENREGAGSTIGSAAVANAPADGYTILFNGTGLTFHPGLFSNLPYDVKADFRPVAVVAGQPFVLYASNDLEADGIQELVALAKADPGNIPYASVGIGSSGHLASELLFNDLGVEFLHIPYPGTPAAMNDLIAGEVKFLYTTISGGGDMLRAGRIKALGISSVDRADALPEVPTIAEQDVPGYEFASWLAMFVPADTPDEVVAILAEATGEVLADPAVQDQFTSNGLTVVNTSVAEAQDFFVAEVDRWIEVIGSVGIDAQ